MRTRRMRRMRRMRQPGEQQSVQRYDYAGELDHGLCLSRDRWLREKQGRQVLFSPSLLPPSVLDPSALGPRSSVLPGPTPPPPPSFLFLLSETLPHVAHAALYETACPP
eukprot:8687868-Pyramimonas_sp.AAC.1